jgi:hypothetical protein
MKLELLTNDTYASGAISTNDISCSIPSSPPLSLFSLGTFYLPEGMPINEMASKNTQAQGL